MKIIIETDDNGFSSVRVDDAFATLLTRDEILGVVASALFSDKGPIFVRTYEQTVTYPWADSARTYKEGPHKLIEYIKL